ARVVRERRHRGLPSRRGHRATGCRMAFPAYLSIVGQAQGPIEGSVTQKGREGKILVISVEHEIVSPRDPASGVPTGKRAHKPFWLIKEVDRASPLLYSALANNENLPSWQLQFYRPGPTGVERQHYTVKLTNATVCGITCKMANVRVPKLARFETYEEIAFTYQKIEWIWTEGGITTTDDWVSPQNS